MRGEKREVERNPVKAWLDRRVGSALEFSVHTPMLGLARSFLALGTLIGLVGTPLDHLFYPSVPRPSGRVCEGLASSIGAFCVVPVDYLGTMRWASVVVLLLVLIGIAPRMTAIPHWWVSFSFYSSSNVMEGGDQVAAVLTFLLIPICLTDARRWHWQPVRVQERNGVRTSVFNSLVLFLIWVQVCVIYFHASLGKLALESWRDGTSFWYWSLYSPFGAPDYLRGFFEWALPNGIVVVGITWGSVLIEFFLACCLFAGHWVRKIGLVLGCALHASIALVMGIPGFSIIMFGALLMYLVRPGDPVPVWVPSGKERTGRRSEAEESARSGSSFV